jgi:hypothetical protein
LPVKPRAERTVSRATFEALPGFCLFNPLLKIQAIRNAGGR